METTRRSRRQSAVLVPALALLALLSVSLGWAGPYGELVAQAAPAPSGGPARSAFTYADVLRLRSAHQVQISPDGTRIAYLVSAVDPRKDSSTNSLWLLQVASEQTSELAVQVSGAASWSPDSRQLAFAGKAKDGSPAIVVVNAADPEKRRSFPVPSQPGALVWSPDGRSLALTLSVPDTGQPSFLQEAIHQAQDGLPESDGAERAPALLLTEALRYHADGQGDLARGHTHLFVLSTETGALRQVVSGAFDDASPAWMPDGRHLLFVSDRDPQHAKSFGRAAVQEVDLSTGRVVQLTHLDSWLNHPVASPDGRWIAFAETPARPVNYTATKLMLMRADGSSLHRLAPQLDRDVFDPRWSAGGVLYASFNDHGVGRAGHFGLDGSFTEVATGVESGFSVSDKGDIAYAGDAADHPAEVLLRRPGAAPLTLTALNPFLAQRSLGRLLPLEIPSPSDHAAIGTWVLLPPGAIPGHSLPAIFDLHGGPFGYEAPGWSTVWQLYAAAGYAVIIPNYRGSISYGSSFAEPANTDFPDCAYSGLMSVADAVVRQRIADPNRLYLTGGSAGGELTAWTIGKTRRFRAAVAEKPVINQISDTLDTDQYISLTLTRDFPWEHEQAFWARSPLSLVGSVATPTLLITGENDARTPLTETLQFYDALQVRGIPTALVRVPGASHEGLGGRPSQLVAEIAATLAWFHHYDQPPAHP